MRFRAPPPPRAPRESIVPMINVVFLLLVFFLMTATLAPPDPVEIALPSSAGGTDRTDGARILHVDASGVPHLGDRRGRAALEALAGTDAPLEIRADAAVDGQRFARLLADPALSRITTINLVTVPR